MNEDTENAQDDFSSEEFDPNTAAPEPTVATVSNPAVANGNGHAAPANTINEKVTRTYSIPRAMSQLPADLMGQANRRIATATRDSEKTKDDREWLDAFMGKAEAGDHQLAVSRYYPHTNIDGDPVPTGPDSRHLMPVDYYDNLQTTISEVWGGGRYRITICDSQGRRVDDITRCILLDISTVQYPPKRIKYEKLEPVRSLKNGTAVVAPPVDDELTQKRRERDLLLEEERISEQQDRILNAKREREYKSKKRDLELAQLERELNPRKDEKNAELALLEKRLEEEKRERERKYDEDRREREEAARRADEDRKERERKYEADRLESARRYEEDKKDAQRRSDEVQRRADEDRKAFMEAQNNMALKLTELANKPPPPKDDTMAQMLAVMAPVLTAIISKPLPPPPDNKELFLALSHAQSESSKQIASMTTSLLAAPKADPMATYMPMMMEVVKGNKVGENNLINNLITSLVSNKGDALTPEVMMQLMQMGEKRAERLIELANGGGHGNQGGQDGEDYDPSLGFLGNAGKMLFGGLKELMSQGMNNPQILELIKHFAGTKNPTDRQLAQAVWQMEQNSQLPNVAQQPQLPQPGQWAPTDVAAVPYPQRPTPDQLNRARSGPPPLPGQQPRPVQPPPAVTQQSAIANELEGAASGLPSNGDPEDAPPTTPEQLADDELRAAVTHTVETIIADTVNKPAKREWPEDATEHWSRAFIKQICDCPYEQGPGSRLHILGSKCEPAVAAQLSQLLQTNAEELAIFWNEFRRFVDMNVKLFAQQAQAAPPMQPTQPQAPPVTPAPLPPQAPAVQ